MSTLPRADGAVELGWCGDNVGVDAFPVVSHGGGDARRGAALTLVRPALPVPPPPPVEPPRPVSRGWRRYEPPPPVLAAPVLAPVSLRLVRVRGSAVFVGVARAAAARERRPCTWLHTERGVWGVWLHTGEVWTDGRYGGLLPDWPDVKMGEVPVVTYAPTTGALSVTVGGEEARVVCVVPAVPGDARAALEFALALDPGVSIRVAS